MTPPISIGGGTFARATENIVCFGPHPIDKPHHSFQKDDLLIFDD